jgi:dipeptidyl aminopeptidase/acylaminoacyl peptidase
MKKLIKFLFLGITVFSIFACNKSKYYSNVGKDNFKYNNPDFSKGIMTPEILWSFGRIGQTVLSPDQTKVLFSVAYYSIQENKSKTELYILDLKNKKTTRLTTNNINEYSPTWRPDEKKIAFLAADKNGVMQIWEINPDGTQMHKITNQKKDITTFRYAPTNDKILFTSDVKVKKTVHDIYPDLPKANARIITDLMFRHWNTWEDSYFSHVFVANYNPKNSRLSNITDIMPNEPYDVPMKPFDGVENLVFSHNGKFIAYTCKKLYGKQYALSTNSDIYLYDIQNKTTKNISAPNPGYDKNPTFSYDDSKIAWESMQRDGYEADKVRIFVKNLKTGELKNYSKNFDQNASHLVWSKNDKTIYFISGIKATYQLYKLDTDNGKISQITKGTHDIVSFNLADKFAIANIQSMSSPTEIFKINLNNGKITQLSEVNKKIMSKIKMGKVEKRWITTTDNKKMLTWIIYPPNFDSTKKYPALLYCQGGPQSAVSQFFSYRWNFQIMAANGYIVVAPNRRGLPTFGQQWNEEISKDYGGQNMQDYLSAIDAVSKEPYVDKNRLGAVGASYGGLSIFWLAGHHNHRFKVFIAHDGIFDFVSMYGSTEELWFVNWDLGGPYWNPTPKNSYSASPNLFVKNWDTPIMIVQGGKDYRVPETQAFEAFTAAKLKGLDAKLLYFPDECHWVLKPQDGILWQREFFSWLAKYLKK